MSSATAVPGPTAAASRSPTGTTSPPASPRPRTGSSTRGPGGWNDLDSLEIGNGDQVGLTADQRRSHMTLWAMAASPLLLGTDLTALNATDKAMLTNDRLIAVNQDGVAAKRIVNSGPKQVWSKREAERRLHRRALQHRHLRQPDRQRELVAGRLLRRRRRHRPLVRPERRHGQRLLQRDPAAGGDPADPGHPAVGHHRPVRGRERLVQRGVDRRHRPRRLQRHAASSTRPTRRARMWSGRSNRRPPGMPH